MKSSVLHGNRITPFAAVFVTGFAGIIAQIILLRELMVSVYGNELSIGIILANWLILEACGCFFLGRTIEKIKNKLRAFIILQIIFSLFFPASIYFARVFKQFIGAEAGEGLGIVPMFVSSFIIILPLSLSHGALFTFACRIYPMQVPAKENSSREKNRGACLIGSVYVYETIGAIAGGIAINFLIQHFCSLTISFIIGLLNFFICLLLVQVFGKNFNGGNTSLKIMVWGCIAVFAVFGGNIQRIHNLSIRQQWKGQNIINYENSIYGNVAVGRRGEQYTFYSNGIPIIAVPTPDVMFTEEFVHIPMLSHPKPEQVLIISGGAGGVINEVLKHGVKEVDYAELDPLLLKLVKKYSTGLTESELGDPRVNVEYVDGRLFTRTTGNKYDIILVGLSNPSDLQLNRLFTKEFFKEAGKRLNNGGILTITVPGSLVYLSEELSNLNGCILRTLQSVFKYVRIVPGDTNLYLASDSPAMLSAETDLMVKRLKERKLNLNLINDTYIQYKLDKQKLNRFLEAVNKKAGINMDFLPLGFFYSVCYWNSLFSPYLKSVFKILGGINLKKLSILFCAALIVSLLFYQRIRNMVFPFAIMSTGFSGMIFQLTLIFAFQAIYGYVYYRIAFLITAFMAGIAGGSFIIMHFMEKFRKNRLVFFRTELGITCFSVILPLILIYSGSRLTDGILLQLLFPVLCLVSGFLTGMEFPLANKIYLPVSKSISSSAGFLYGSDLIGGWFGGILGGVVLLPVMGLLGTCLTVTMLKLCSTLLVRRSL